MSFLTSFHNFVKKSLSSWNVWIPQQYLNDFIIIIITRVSLVLSIIRTSNKSLRQANKVLSQISIGKML